MQDFWVSLWAVIWYGGLTIFALLSVFVIIFGGSDLLALLSSLKIRHEEQEAVEAEMAEEAAQADES
ncbi:MAG: hypothetical protein QM473_19050 [Acidobacteriota bacterium]|jgi:hypothetical protein|nr:hypothetical protein [Acidobacteriota bacterium]